MSRNSYRFNKERKPRRRHGKFLGEDDKGWDGRNWRQHVLDEVKEQRVLDAGAGGEK